jgi:DNA polymerase III alpha subunit
MTLAGVARFHAACAAAGIRPITGCELIVAHGPTAHDSRLGTLIALARDRVGYATLCQLLTRANRANPQRPSIPLVDLAAQHAGLMLLICGCDSLIQRLLLAGHIAQARAVISAYITHLGVSNLCMELRHHRLPESGPLISRLAALAAEFGITCVAANGARYATAEDCSLYDLLTCVRLGITVDQPHPERPRKPEDYLKSAAELRPLFTAAPAAFLNAATLASECHVELRATHCIPPHVSPYLPA